MIVKIKFIYYLVKFQFFFLIFIETFYNIVNKKLFWKVDISEIIKKNTKIVNISNYNNSIMIFFNNGLILEVNSKNGNIISDNNLKINDIISIQNANEYLLVDQINGKTTIINK